MKRQSCIPSAGRPTRPPPLSATRVCILLFLAVACTLEGMDHVHAQSLISGDLTVGFSNRAFAGVNRNDAEAAFKAFLVSVGRQRGYDLVARTQVLSSGPEFETAIRSGKLQLSIIPTWEYLSMDIHDVADPFFVAVDEEGILEEYLLLTRRDSGLRSLMDLRGKSVSILESVGAYMSMNWIETVLLQQQLGTPDSFFSRVEKVTKSSNAVLSVFFGKHHACVVDRAAFNVMTELNPQVGERLQIVNASEPFLDAVVCLSKSGWMSAQHKEDTWQGLADLHKVPAGQQILTLFRVSRMAPFKPEYLVSVRKLKDTHDRLAAAQKQSLRLEPRKE